MDQVDPGQEPQDGLPYTTLVYGNGPGPGREENLTGVDTSKYRARETICLAWIPLSTGQGRQSAWRGYH